MTLIAKPVLTPRKLAARRRWGRLHVTLDTGRLRCTVCGQEDRRSRAHDPHNWSSGDRMYCRHCQGWTIPAIEFAEVILDLASDSANQEAVLRFQRPAASRESAHV